jgi:hypothetical protein
MQLITLPLCLLTVEVRFLEVVEHFSTYGCGFFDTSTPSCTVRTCSGVVLRSKPRTVYSGLGSEGGCGNKCIAHCTAA